MIGDNIKELRKILDLTQKKFAERINLKQATIATAESNKSQLSPQAKAAICREFRVNPEWLETGEGEMFKPRDDSLIAQLAADYGLNENDVAAIESFLELSPEHRRGVLEWGKNLMKKLATQMDIELPAVDEENAARDSGALTADEAAEIIRQEFDDKLSAEKRGTSTSLASTGTSGMRKKFGNKT